MSRRRANTNVRITDDQSEQARWGNTLFHERKVAEKTQQFILNSSLPLSNQRDVQTTTNSGSITKVDAEYRVRADATANSTARLQSKRRGNYISGNVAEAGIGIRVPTQPTGDAFVRWGYYKELPSGLTGIYFEYDKDGLKVVLADKGTVIHSRYQQRWNLEELDDNNNLGDLDLSGGHLFQINFAYYGYASIGWEIGIGHNEDSFNTVLVHLFKRDEATSLSEPNLPLTVEADSGTSGQQLDVYVGGRQFSTFGKELPSSRTVGAYRLEQGSIGTTFLPTISFKHKTGFKNIIILFNGISFLSDADLIWRITKNATLTGATFSSPNGYTASEVATEWDVAATATTGGEVIDSGFAGGGNKDELTSKTLPNKTIAEDDTYTLEIRRISGTNATVTTHLSIEEQW